MVRLTKGIPDQGAAAGPGIFTRSKVEVSADSGAAAGRYPSLQKKLVRATAIACVRLANKMAALVSFPREAEVLQ